MRNQKSKDSDKSGNSYLRYSGLGMQLFLTIGLFAWLGYKMDQWWNDDAPLFVIIMIFLGVVGGFYNFFRAVNPNNKE